MESFFPTFRFVKISILIENPNHWGLKTAVCPIFVKPVEDIFPVCLLVPRMNLYHTQQNYLCPKNQNYLLEKADLTFFFEYELRTIIKITIFSTFYVTDKFSSCYNQYSCKKTLFQYFFFQVKMKPPNVKQMLLKL